MVRFYFIPLCSLCLLPPSICMSLDLNAYSSPRKTGGNRGASANAANNSNTNNNNMNGSNGTNGADGGGGSSVRDESDTTYEQLLSSEFLGKGSVTTSVLSYNQSPQKSPSQPSPFSLSPVSGPSGQQRKGAKMHRKIPSTPYKVLDAPCLHDDF